MKPGPVLTLTVDDCWRDHAIAFRKAFDAVRMRAVFYVIADFAGNEVGGIKFLDWESLREMARSDSHEIGSHSLTHRGAELGSFRQAIRMLSQIRSEGVRRASKHFVYVMRARREEYEVQHLPLRDEVFISKERIEQKTGRPCRSYSYPGGGYTRDLKEMVLAAGYSSARTGYSGYNSSDKMDKYALRVRSWDRNTTSAEANSWVNAAIEKGCWLIEVFHTVGQQSYLYDCSRSELDAHLNYAKTRGKEMQVLPISEVL